MKISVLLAIVVLAFGRCNTTMYVSNAVNAPLLSERGEVKVNLASNNAQVAVGVTDHVGIMLNGFYNQYNGDNGYQHRGGLVEAGAGYFINNGNVILDGYAGIGRGLVYKKETFRDVNESQVHASFSANANKFFIQPDIGYRNKIVDLVFSPRFSFVKYSGFTATNYTQEALAKDYLDNNRLTSGIFTFAEPAFTFRIGYKFIKVQAQYGLTLNMTSRQIRHPANFGSIGVVFDVARWYNDK